MTALVSMDMLALSVCLVCMQVAPFALALAAVPESYDLQSYHTSRSPSEALHSIGDACLDFGVEKADVYGDYHLDEKTSYLRKFEAQVARDFGKEDAVFCPSGVMAQSIALMIHGGKFFACHDTSHLLLHEEDGYRELLGMEAVHITTSALPDEYSIPAMTCDDVQKAFETFHESRSPFDLSKQKISTLFLELPHRELGGKLTPWDEVLKMGAFCRDRGIKFHCDGARIFEAGAGYGLSLSEMAQPFDSVYISFYKGLGALSGAMLLGTSDFCEQARKWLRRFGGNIYTLLPYIVSSMAGYEKHVKGVQNHYDFSAKRSKLIRLVTDLSKDPDISSVLVFDPPIPEVNMVHGYLTANVEQCRRAVDEVERQSGVRVLVKISHLREDHPAYTLGYKSKFEWTMGDANSQIDDEVFLRGWKEFSKSLLKEASKE